MTVSQNKNKKRSTAKAKTPKTPRSRESRREETRGRILDATLHCLAREGYAGTGVAQVVAQAGVSRGAWSHHFPSMNVLFLEAAQHLMTQVYARFAQVLTHLASNADDPEQLVLSVWEEFFASEVNEVYLELLIASRREPGLAKKLAQLSNALQSNLDSLSASRFETSPQAVVAPMQLLMLTRWLLRGMALDSPLVPEAKLREAMKTWAQVIGSQMRVRKSMAAPKN